MQYSNPVYYLLFLPIVVLLYQLFPKKKRWLVLLGASYVFFWLISGKLLIYLLLSTFSIHHFGLWLTVLQEERDHKLKDVAKEERKEIKRQYQKKQWHVILFALFLHIGLLIVLKYARFLGTNVNQVLNLFHFDYQVPIMSFFIPIGISFYTLQAVSYLFDVYRGTISADKNLPRLALYMSFFPQIMEGPICRYADTAQSLWSGEGLRYQNITFGSQRILFGLLKKIVVADRLNAFVRIVFNGYQDYDGGIIALAVICYTCQLYMDFSGTIDVVIGSGEIFGIRLPENFRQPFFSKTVSEFWTRWHITLGTWFKDYIFYPLSLSKPLKKLTLGARKHLGNHFGPLLAGSIALFCVWLCNGIWHGAAWNYIFFGMYYFVLILLGSLIEPVVIRVTNRFKINRNALPYQLLQITRTVFLVLIGELFFRANGLKSGLLMFEKLFTNFSFRSFQDGTFLKLGLDRHDFFIVLGVVVVVFVVGLLKEHGIKVREGIARQNIVIRWILYYSLILSIIIFGAYGPGYVPVDPIYAGF